MRFAKVSVLVLTVVALVVLTSAPSLAGEMPEDYLYVLKGLQKDFGIHSTADIREQYEYTGWVRWRDGSYCLVFSDAEPKLWLYASGLMAGDAAGIQFLGGRAFGGKRVFVQARPLGRPILACGRQDTTPWSFGITSNRP